MHYYAAREWGDAAEVVSAGTWAEIGLDATREMRVTARRYGLEMPRHRPAQLEQAHAARADLVLVATQQHATWIERRTGGSIPEHIFGIRQAADLARRAEPPAGATPAERLRNAAAALAAEHRREPAPLRSLDDPWGLNVDTHDRVMDEIISDIDALTEWARLKA
jgi:protein-tyrosine phosphatase